MPGSRSSTSTATGVPRRPPRVTGPSRPGGRCSGTAHVRPLVQQDNAAKPHGGPRMQSQVLRVGETLVMDDDIHLTVLAVEGDSVVLGVTAPGPIDPGGAAEGGRRRRPRLRPTLAPLPEEQGSPAGGGAARRALTDGAGRPGPQGAVMAQQTLQEHALVQTLTEALRLTAGRGAEGDARPPNLSALRFLGRSFQRH